VIKTNKEGTPMGNQLTLTHLRIAIKLLLEADNNEPV